MAKANDEPVSTVCRSCHMPAHAEKSRRSGYTGHWFHDEEPFLPHNVDPSMDSLHLLRRAMLKRP